jgi:hypothetical protein
MGTVRVTQQYNEVLFADPYSVTAREFNKTATSALAIKQVSGHSPVRRYERFANDAGSSLSASIDDTVTSLTVASATSFPIEGNFRIIIDDEIMLVVNVIGLTFIVVRAQESTTAAAHSASAGVFHVLTAGALLSRDTDARATDLFVNRDAPGQAGRLYLPTAGYVARDSGTVWESMPLWKMTPPVIGDFTWVNQGTSAITDVKGITVLEPQSVASGESLRMLVKAVPTPPYRITVAFIAQSGSKNTAAGGQYGVCWRDSGTGKVITWGLGTDAYNNVLYHTRWASPTSVTTQVANYKTPTSHPYWLRISDDGTNRWVEISGDGYRYQGVLAPEGRTTHITADQVGIFANSYLSSTVVRRIISYLHWSES